MRGLMAKPKKSTAGGGENCEILSNFKEGLSILSTSFTHGARVLRIRL
jgi:DNA-directed RNA polymerase subunit beta'